MTKTEMRVVTFAPATPGWRLWMVDTETCPSTEATIAGWVTNQLPNPAGLHAAGLGGQVAQLGAGGPHLFGGGLVGGQWVGLGWPTFLEVVAGDGGGFR